MSNGAHQQPSLGQEQDQPVDSTQGDQRKEDASQQQTYRQVAASHIDTLSEINRQLPKLLTWFAIALTQLTNNPIHDSDQEGQPDSLEARQAAFRKWAMYVEKSTDVIRKELTEQINDLERYKVIPKSHPKYSAVNRPVDKGDKEVNDAEKNVKNGGYGEFDVGVLNARASSGRVGGEDVLDRVKAILEELKRRTEGEANGESMAVD